ncbi:callose synthase 1-like [Carica papaya]|uniref:callose synthase 1-like n=1 Tax=Carica papaya TaxID=3649 RepID=UPI000B8CD334|nr:callose synthase 1-like [Carica papaya]
MGWGDVQMEKLRQPKSAMRELRAVRFGSSATQRDMNRVCDARLGEGEPDAVRTAFELYGLLAGNVSVITGAYVRPTYAGEEAFLRKVITPVYEVIAREAKKSKRGKLKDLQQRNYDVLNQYFRSVDCFRLGWPLRPDILHMPLAQLPSKRNAVRNYCGDSSANIKNPICFPEHLHFLQNVWCITKHPYASLWLMA